MFRETPQMFRETPQTVAGRTIVKRHKFWALAATFCMIMTLYTGYKHK